MKSFVVLAVIIASVFAESVYDWPDEVPLEENGLAALLAEYGGMIPMRDGRIVGGEAVSINSFPWMLTLRLNGAHRCGATIISTTRGLSAAQCTDSIAGDAFQVRAGSTQHAGGGQLVATSNVINHPQYDSATLNNDICVLILASALDTAPVGVAVVAMHAAGASVGAGVSVTTAGWGATCEGCDGTASLRAVSKPVVTNAACNTMYGGGITAGMMCAGFAIGGRGACDGDTGGPLTFGTTLVGIVSWSSGCARPNLPDIYARVAHYRTWINGNL